MSREGSYALGTMTREQGVEELRIRALEEPADMCHSANYGASAPGGQSPAMATASARV